jgi:hypothetical protein
VASRKAAKQPELRPSLGGDVCDWIESYLCHGPGDVQGEPLDLDDEFRAFIWRAYEVYPKGHPREGRRVYHRAFLSRPKGRAKSELAGALACAEGLGPVRFDGWDARGNPVGRPVTAPIVRCFATEEGQAGNTYENVFFMLSEGPVASDSDFDGLDVGLTRTNLPDGGQIKALTSAASSKDGGKDTFNVFDETHLWKTPELHRLHNTVTRNLGKRKLSDGWALETSTMYGLGEGSVAESTHEYARMGRDSGLLFDHREAPAGVDLEDDEQILGALRFVYGAAAEWMDLQGLIDREFHDPAKSEADNRRYWFNQPVKLAGRLVDPAQLKMMEDPARLVAPRTRVVLGFDGSKNRDATALVAWTVEDRPHLFTIRIWKRPENASSDWQVPRVEVDAAIKACFDRFDVRRLVCDPPGWRSEIEAWATEFGEETVLVFDTNQPSRMAPACDRFDVAVKVASFTWDGNEDLRTHLSNCERKETRWGPLVVKPDGRQTDKIDAAVAAIVGFSELTHLPVRVHSARQWLESLAPPCPSCGQPNPAGSAHCSKCSAALDGTTEPAEPAEAPETEPQPESETPPEASWTPWSAPKPGQMLPQTAAAFKMLDAMKQGARW